MTHFNANNQLEVEVHCQPGSSGFQRSANMTFADLISDILRNKPDGMTPQEIRDTIKRDYPGYYGTESQRRNVEKGHYSSLDHALQAQVYVASRKGRFQIDRSSKPFRMTLSNTDNIEFNESADETIDTENLERLEAGIGTLYVLGTNLFTKEGNEIIKIGITSGDVEARITQLYTTGVPFRFRVIKTIETANYSELEHSLHKLLDPYRINRSREFFLDTCLDYVDKVASLHKSILTNAEQGGAHQSTTAP